MKMNNVDKVKNMVIEKSNTQCISHDEFEKRLDESLEAMFMSIHGGDKCTLDDIAILMAAQDHPDHDKLKEIPVKSKMYWCKYEKKVMEKLRHTFASKFKITDYSDVSGEDRWHSPAKMRGVSDFEAE